VVSSLPLPVLADLCLVDLLEPSGQLSSLPAAHVGLEPSVVPLAERLLRASWEGFNMATRSMRTGSPSLQARVDPALELPLAELGMRCVLSVPLVVQNRSLGVVTLVRSTSRPCFGAEDVRTAEALVRRMALTLDHAFLYREKERLSQTLQESILPSRLPAIPGMEVAAWYTPAVPGLLVGGDFYDVLRVGEDWAVVLGDVTGKGATAAARTALARYTLAAACVPRRRPSRILAALNEAVQHHGLHGLFGTVAMARIRPGRERAHLTLALAGHPQPLLVRASGEVQRVGKCGLIIGLKENAVFADRTLEMRTGDTLLLYTDGLTDARSYARGDFGEERVADVLRACAGGSAAEVIQRFRRELDAFEWLRDDIALMALRYTG